MPLAQKAEHMTLIDSVNGKHLRLIIKRNESSSLSSITIIMESGVQFPDGTPIVN